MPDKIYYRKQRELSGIFSAAFGFVKQNFKPFYGSIFLLAGPFLLIASTVSSLTLTTSPIFGLNPYIPGGSTNYNNLLASYFIIIFVAMIGLSIFTVLLNKNVLENEMLENEQKLNLQTTYAGFFNHYWWVLGNMLLFGFIAAIVGVFVILIMGGMIGFMGSVAFGSVFISAILFILMFILFLILIPILLFIPTAALFVCQRDKINIFIALGKVSRYIRHNFWNTWVLSFIALLTYALLAGVVQVPAIILNLITVFSRSNDTGLMDSGSGSKSLLLVMVNVICALLSYGALSIYHLLTIYQYGNLEEKNEGLSVLDKINKIG